VTAHVVWDFNGTLFDDHDAVVASVGDALATVGLPAIDAATYRALYTRPVKVFYERLTGRGVEDAEWEALDDVFHDAYLGRLASVGLTDGALAAMEAVEDAGVTQSLLSMWRHEDLVPAVERLGIARFFTRVDGLRGPGGGFKAEHLANHLKELGLDGCDAALIGDALDDLAAARSAGAVCVLYEGGTHEPDALAETGAPVVTSLGDAVALVLSGRRSR
jgi:phosphoglycolate phosphatase-like HAD superfamily hydrolase